MKKKIVIALTFMATTIISPQLFAQTESRSPDQKIKTKSNIKNDKVSVVTISSNAAGCTIAVGDRVVSSRDAASGLSTGKRMHKPFVITKELDISSTNNAVTEVTSPRDVATGQASGKASFSDLSVMIQGKGKSPIALSEEDGEFNIPADCPNGDCTMIVSWSWGASNSGSSNRCEKSFTLTMENGVCMAINEKGTAGTKGSSK